MKAPNRLPNTKPSAPITNKHAPHTHNPQPKAAPRWLRRHRGHASRVRQQDERCWKRIAWGQKAQRSALANIPNQPSTQESPRNILEKPPTNPPLGSRYIYDLYYEKEAITKPLYDWLLKNNYADAMLIAKWKKPGYEKVCLPSNQH
jgi:hypothetical protein